MFDMQSAGRGAAIIVEPVISAGGVLVPPKSFMQALRKAADDRGMLLIFDEAQTAFGRIGTRTGSEYFGVVPDIMTMSKTLGGGLPLAAVATTAKIEEVLHREALHLLHEPCLRSADRRSRPRGAEGDRGGEADRARERRWAPTCAAGSKGCSSATR